MQHGMKMKIAGKLRRGQAQTSLLVCLATPSWPRLGRPHETLLCPTIYHMQTTCLDVNQGLLVQNGSAAEDLHTQTKTPHGA